MTELEKIADLVKRAYDGTAWSGPSLVELLSNVTAEKAAARPIEDAHSIWEIVTHITAWEEVVTRRLQGEPYREYAADEDWPPVENTSDSAWAGVLKRLRTSNETLRQAILGFEQTRLSEVVPSADYVFYVMIHGAVQHDFYHAGQIGILKRAVEAHGRTSTVSG